MPQPCDDFADAPCGDCPDGADAALSLRIATNIMWRLTGQRFGVCTVEVGVCPEDHCRCGGLAEPRLVDGKWYNCCGWSDNTRRLKLPLTPVAQLGSVTIAGVDRTADFNLIHHKYLELCAGDDWPTNSAGCGCQGDASCSSCEPTFVVRYAWGREVPAELAWATSILAHEFCLLQCGDTSNCRLPSNVTTVSRQGVTQQFGGIDSIVERGLTGISEIDLVIGALSGRRNPGRVIDPLHPRRTLAGS